MRQEEKKGVSKRQGIIDETRKPERRSLMDCVGEEKI